MEQLTVRSQCERQICWRPVPKVSFNMYVAASVSCSVLLVGIGNGLFDGHRSLLVRGVKDRIQIQDIAASSMSLSLFGPLACCA